MSRALLIPAIDTQHVPLPRRAGNHKWLGGADA